MATRPPHEVKSDEELEYCKLYWDYYGPSAEGTAMHFKHHLEEWIQRSGLESSLLKTQVEKNTEMHFSATCIIKLSDGEGVYRALRAHRAVKVVPSKSAH